MTQAATIPLRDKLGGAESAQGPGFWMGLAPCLYYLFIEFARPMSWIPAISVIRPGLLASAWALVAMLIAKRRPMPRPSIYILAFTALMVYHVFGALNNFVAYTFLVYYWTPMLLCLLAISVLPTRPSQVRALLFAYFYFHIPTAISGIVRGGVGLGAWLRDENDMAFALNAAIGLGIYLVMETRSNLQKILIGSGMGLMVVAIIMSASRGGFVGLVAVLLYLLVTGKRRMLIAGFVLVAVVVAVAVAPASYWEEVKTIRTAHEPGDTGDKRQYYWIIAWRMFLDHPIAGVGTDNYGIRAIEYENRDRYRQSMWRRVSHSLYFTLIPEHGLIGIVLFSMIIVWFVKSHRRIQREAAGSGSDESLRTALLGSGVMASMVAVLATGVFLYVLYYPPLWVLVGLMASLEATRPALARTERGPAGTP